MEECCHTAGKIKQNAEGNEALRHKGSEATSRSVPTSVKAPVGDTAEKGMSEPRFLGLKDLVELERLPA